MAIVPVTDKMRVAVFALLLALPDYASAKDLECKSPLGAAVPDMKTARAVATAVISARQTPKRSKEYRLVIEADNERSGRWLAFQSLPEARSRDPEKMIVIHGGGRLTMRIDRCTGEISDFHYQR